MRETFWGYWLVLLGVLIIGVMLLVNNITSTNTEDYYSLKEVTQASMVDAMDFSYYRLYGNIKISEQKFVENFLRRFSENVNLSKTYDVGFYDLYEVPPKVSVRIATKSGSYNVGQSLANSYDAVTTFSSILELGSVGEGNKIKDGDKACKMYIQSKLLKYLKGQTIDGHSLVGDGYGSFYSQDALAQLANINDMDSFKHWFNENTIVNGQVARQSLPTTPYKQLPTAIRVWINRGWIEITT